ncbi:unnamed protein product [Adineta steineri]|uniref:Hedgehog protein Hint domain-containing protein n=2 Tax=Adineta steineri TaxID=433720 RepID=A0A814RW56_9BILA|nr:unnamed protein product [Adineta steineri]CAF3860744.1 unnamed protein product [Adineta steineri]
MMNNHRILYLTIFVLFLFDLTISATPNCPVEADPTTILSCVAIDAVGLVQATKGNIRAFCTMAERFMECLKTKTRGCIGEDFVRGSLSELIELSQKCCVNKGERMSEECPFVSKPQCFYMTDMATSPKGNEIPIKDLQIGEQVLAIDHNDQIVSTEIVSFLHYENNSQTFFYIFTTETGHQISVTSDHLMFIGNQTYIQARFIDLTQHNLYIMGSNGQLQPSRIRSIDVQLKQGYATPITQHGTLIVNNISASCYSSIYHHNLGHMAMAPLRWFHQAKQIFGVVNNNEMIKNGIHWYPRTLNNFLHIFRPLANVFTTTMGNI